MDVEDGVIPLVSGATPQSLDERPTTGHHWIRIERTP